MSWCQNNDLILNTSKTKTVVTDFRKHEVTMYVSLVISGEEVEHVWSFKHLGVHL